MLKSCRMLFIGTVPIVINSEHSKEIEKQPSYSNFYKIKEFLNKHQNIDYDFLILSLDNKHNNVRDTIDLSYIDFIITYNLRKGCPNIGEYDIVYVDTDRKSVV